MLSAEFSISNEPTYGVFGNACTKFPARSDASPVFEGSCEFGNSAYVDGYEGRNCVLRDER